MHNLPIEEVLKKVQSSKKGLSDGEARKRLDLFGYNRLEQRKKTSALKLFLDQFNNALVIILLVAAAISFAISYLEHGEYLDSILIVTIVFANAIFGFIQEYKAEKTIETLSKLAAPKARVLRNGKEEHLASELVVPGDILIIREGDQIAADARIIESNSLYVDESSLTGESVPVEKGECILKKEIPLAERKNMVYMGTIATRGKAIAVVTHTGMKTEMGKIAKEIVDAPKKVTRFQEEIEVLGKKILYITVLLLGVISAVELAVKGSPLLVVFTTAVALGVAAIPEGLPAVVTFALSIATNRMLKQQVLMRKLSTIQNLGSVDIICTDKTGTLTENKMTVVKIETVSNEYVVGGIGYDKYGELEVIETDRIALELMLKAAVLCNDAKEQEGEFIGDPTEIALLFPAYKLGWDVDELRTKEKRLDEIPFSSERKMMSTLHPDKLYSKGAAEAILEKCNRYLEGSKIKKLSKSKKAAFLKQSEKMASSALRVLAFAYKETKTLEEKNLIFLGFMGMIDPPRKGVFEALEDCRKAGIKIIMITGDHPLTAKAIGRELGFKGDILTGKDLDELNEVELEEKIKTTEIFARTNPSHKVQILKILKKQKHTVAMTGDGVNDAPALKNADVGIAMGIRGTEVTKQASDMVVLDDNFISIRNAIREGRGSFDNIRKFVTLLLGANSSEIIAIFLISLLPIPLSPKIAVQLLWINLLTDGLPALALGAEEPAKDIMKRKPRPKKEGVLNRDVYYFIGVMGIAEAIAVMSAYLIYLDDVAKAYTVFFTAFVFYELISVYLVRWRYNSRFFSNKWVHLAMLLSISLQFFVLYGPLQEWFGVVPLSILDLVILLSIGLLFSAVVIILAKLGKKIDWFKKFAEKDKV